MTHLTCMHCLEAGRSVRYVEHGTDHMPLCKSCFADMKREFDNRSDSDA